MVIMDEISTIKAYFRSHQVPVSTEWLEGCINWCKEENPANSLKELQSRVCEQWLYLDLRDVELPSLPPNLLNKVEYILNGNYSLQMMKVIDISRPKYWQLQKIRTNTSKNLDQEIETSKRVLQLTLTDGVQEIEAMEYTPIPCLNLNLNPGIKIRIMGPISVRRGRLMLESKHVKILGGEVEDLIVPNAAENVLASHFNLPLNPKPHVITESLMSADLDTFKKEDEAKPRLPNITNVQNKMVQQNQRPLIPREDGILMNEINEEEEKRLAEEIDMLMDVERDFQQPSCSKRKRSATPDLFDDQDLTDDIFQAIDIPPAVIKTPQLKHQSRDTRTLNMTTTDNNLNVNIDVDDDVFENIDIDAHLDQAVKKSEQHSDGFRKPLVFTVEKLLRNITNISNGKFKIEAKFVNVVEKLTVNDEKYYLIVKIADQTGELTVKVHDAVVADMAGCCASALLSLKHRIMDNDKEAQNEVLEALGNVKDKLLELNNIVEVQVNSNEKYPVIVSIVK